MKTSGFFSAIFIFLFYSTECISQNIGIGVTNPLQKLHVGGNVRIDGMAAAGTGVITTNANGDLLRTNFSGNANDVLKGNGSFGTVPGGLPSGAIVASASSNDVNLLAAGYSFYGELSTPTTNYRSFTGVISNQFTQAPTYENGYPAKTQPPLGRDGAVGLWTGTEALIWGGYTVSGNIFYPFNDGSRYNTSTDNWTNISTVNAPSSRISPAAVWTGTEMLIWGGLDSAYIVYDASGVYEFVNNGGRYNPSTNTWTTMSSTNAPTPRYKIPAIWTGTYMVVLGGVAESSSFNDGGRYNPTTNTWSSISTSLNAPGQVEKMFWTGTYVLVLGNQDSIGRYLPNTNTWVPTANFPGPAFYNKNASVWTGSELWIFDKTSNRIFKYNPTSNTWAAPTSIGGSFFPDPNFFVETAVWSDTEMILYGTLLVLDVYYKSVQNRYYRYNPGSNDFINHQAINYNRLVDNALFFKAGSMILKWGGVSQIEDKTNGDFTRLSRQGTRIYLTSGIAIPPIYISGTGNNSLYLYKRN